jgi:hypothetical protein
MKLNHKRRQITHEIKNIYNRNTYIWKTEDNYVGKREYTINTTTILRYTPDKRSPIEVIIRESEDDYTINYGMNYKYHRNIPNNVLLSPALFGLE